MTTKVRREMLSTGTQAAMRKLEASSDADLHEHLTDAAASCASGADFFLQRLQAKPSDAPAVADERQRHIDRLSAAMWLLVERSAASRPGET